MAHRVDFSRPCPLKLNPTFDASGNFLCTHCSENVRDFTREDAQAIKTILDDENGSSCGTFRQVYYEGRAGRMQRRLLKRLAQLRENRSSFAKKILIPFVVLLTFLMGCRTRSGAPAYGVKQKPVTVEKHS